MSETSTRTVDRAITLLSLVGEDSPLTLTEAAKLADLAPSTALRLLRTLEASSLVARGDDGQYRPGPRLLQLGAVAFSRDPLSQLARPSMERVVERTGESVYLAVPGSGATALYIGIVEGTHSVRHTNWVGRTVPLAGTAVGRALAGDVDNAGYVVIRKTVEPDVVAICAPIRVGERAAAALSSLVPAYRFDDHKGHLCGQALVEATATIAQALGQPRDTTRPSTRPTRRDLR